MTRFSQQRRRAISLRMTCIMTKLRPVFLRHL